MVGYPDAFNVFRRLQWNIHFVFDLSALIDIHFINYVVLAILF
jgi:hypothetical protein